MTIAISYTTVGSRLDRIIAGILSNAFQSLHLPKHRQMIYRVLICTSLVYSNLCLINHKLENSYCSLRSCSRNPPFVRRSVLHHSLFFNLRKVAFAILLRHPHIDCYYLAPFCKRPCRVNGRNFVVLPRSASLLMTSAAMRICAPRRSTRHAAAVSSASGRPPRSGRRARGGYD